MKGLFVTNKYYTDAGLEYVFKSLKQAFYSRGVAVERDTVTLAYDNLALPQCDFVVFWDKDYLTAAAIEKKGIMVFNNARALEITDDKQKTYAALTGIVIPKTISALLMYDVNDVIDTDFLDLVIRELGFPLVVKENTGSQGRQVHLAQNKDSLISLYTALRHRPHHYQKLTGTYGCDLRIYVAGHKAVASCLRQGTDYKSNLAAGGTISLNSPSVKYLQAAEDISRQLGLDFGAVDFLIDERSDSPVFLEANSNAYFKGIEGLGQDIAGKIVDYIIDRVKNGR